MIQSEIGSIFLWIPESYRKQKQMDYCKSHKQLIQAPRCEFVHKLIHTFCVIKAVWDCSQDCFTLPFRVTILVLSYHNIIAKPINHSALQNCVCCITVPEFLYLFFCSQPVARRMTKTLHLVFDSKKGEMAAGFQT